MSSRAPYSQWSWACSSANSFGALHTIEGNMNEAMYQQVLEENLIKDRIKKKAEAYMV